MGNTEVIPRVENMDYVVKDVLAKLILELGGQVEGIKKLMKLVFLMQYDVKRSITGRRAIKYKYKGQPMARAEFFIWSFGPMSSEVYDALEGSEFRIETRDLPYMIQYVGESPKLPEPVEERVRIIARKYGRKKGWELERHVVELLDLVPEEKKLYYMGWPVDKYLKHENIRLEERELDYG